MSTRPRAPWHAPLTRHAARVRPGAATLAVLLVTLVPLGSAQVGRQLARDHPLVRRVAAAAAGALPRGDR